LARLEPRVGHTIGPQQDDLRHQVPAETGRGRPSGATLTTRCFDNKRPIDLFYWK
jgi:hypothetical protein